MTDFDLTVKIILLGDFSVDKGKLLRALRALPEAPGVTLLRAANGMVEVLFVRNGKRVLAKISDTAGQERFRCITPLFYRGAHGCLLLFDVTQAETFENVTYWLDELQRHTIADDTVVTLVGCNSHVTSDQRQVPEQRAKRLADHLDLPYEEVNVKAVGTLISTLQDIVDRVFCIIASKAPFLNSSMTPAAKVSLGDKQHEQLTRKHCSC